MSEEVAWKAWSAGEWGLLLAPVLGYLALILWATWRSGQRLHAAETGKAGAHNSGEYFLAGRGVHGVLAFVSVVATETSVATVLVFPELGYKTGLVLVWLCAGYIVGRWIVARYYLTRLYERHRLSIYDTVTDGAAGARRSLSAAYLCAKYLSSGVRFFLGGVALATMFGQSPAFWILAMGALAGLYSLTGGLRAVIWTDQLQGFALFAGGLSILAALWIGWNELAPVAQAATIAIESPQWYDFNFSLDNALFSPGFFLGGLILSIGTHGADQDMLQRILATRSPAEARRSLVWSGVGATLVILVYAGAGWFLYETARLHELLGTPADALPAAGAVADADRPLLAYIRLLASPLALGGFAVILIATAMSTLDSALHSTGAIWKSLLEDEGRDPDKADEGAASGEAGARSEAAGGRSSRGLSGRWYGALSLGLLTLFALAFIEVQSVFDRSYLDLAMSSMNYVNGGLIGVFTLFVLQRGAGVSFPATLAALLAGFAVTLLCNHGLDPRPAWTYTTIFSAAAATLAAWLAQRLSGGRR